MLSTWLPELLGAAFALGFGGFGLIMALANLRARMRTAANQTWPSVQGQIDSSEVHRFTSTSHGHTSNSATAYVPWVRYSYSVEGNAYQGKNIGFGVPVSGTKHIAAEVVARCPCRGNLHGLLQSAEPCPGSPRAPHGK